MLSSRVCALSLLPLISSLSFAQTPSRPQTAAEILHNSQQAAGDVDQLRSALRSPDPGVRASTFSAMVDSGNASMMAMAINEAHASADPTMRDLAARAAFNEVSNVVMELASPPTADVKEHYLASAAQGGPALRVDKYDWRTGRADLGSGKAQISGATFSFNNQICRGTLRAIEGSWEYEGIVTCTNGGLPNFMDKLRMRLR